MKSYKISRIVTALLLGLLLGVLLHQDHVTRGRLGREEFLKRQEARFDKFYNTPPPIAEEMFVSVIVIGCLFGVYELTAFGLSKILKA